MKKKISIFLAAMVVTSAVFAGIDNPGAASGMAVIKNGTTYKLYYKGSEQCNVKVSIIDKDNKVVFSEVLKNVDGFVRPYNLSNMEEGDYTISVSDRNNTHTEKVTVKEKSKDTLANVLRVTGEAGKFLLTVPNKEANKITVKIFEGNHMIYDQVEAVSEDFARIYNLKKYTGSLTFEISDSNGNSKTISY